MANSAGPEAMESVPTAWDSAAKPSMFRRTLSWVKLGFVPLAVAFIVYYGWQSRESLGQVLAGASTAMLVVAVLLWTLLHFVSPLFTSTILRACGSDVPYRTSLGIHTGRLPARYLPGGIWHTVARFVDFHERGVRTPHLAVFIFLEHALAVAVTFLIGGGLVFAYRGWEGWGAVGGLGAIGGAFALLFIPVILKHRFLRDAARLSMASYVKGVTLVIVFWLGAALAFLAYLSAFPMVLEQAPWLEVGGTYMFSWGVGFISVFAPQGIGVFEAVMGDMLSSPLAFGGTAVLVAGFRMVILGGDLAAWGMYFFLTDK